MLPMFPPKGMFNVMRTRHQLWMDAASRPRVDVSKLPFDPSSSSPRCRDGTMWNSTRRIKRRSPPIRRHVEALYSHCAGQDRHGRSGGRSNWTCRPTRSRRRSAADEHEGIGAQGLSRSRTTGPLHHNRTRAAGSLVTRRKPGDDLRGACAKRHVARSLPIIHCITESPPSVPAETRWFLRPIVTPRPIPLDVPVLSRLAASIFGRP